MSTFRIEQPARLNWRMALLKFLKAALYSSERRLKLLTTTSSDPRMPSIAVLMAAKMLQKLLSPFHADPAAISYRH